MTLLTDTPAAGGQPPANPPSNTPPSSGDAAAKGGEQAAGKEPAAPAAPAADAAGKAKTDNGGGQPQQGDKSGKPEGDAAGKKPADKSRYYGAPASYELKPLENGASVGELTQTALTEVARELNLSNEAAQLLVEKVSPALQAQSVKNVTAMIDSWVNEVKSDPKLGGDNLKETLAYAQKGLDLAPDPAALRQLLDSPAKGGTGLGNHKAIIAWAAAVGRRLSPDTKVVTGTEVKPPPKTAEERLAASYAPLTD